MVLKVISLLTTQANAYREGLIATLLYNNNVQKKENLKSVEDLLPYLKNGTPDYLEDERVLKARDLLKRICFAEPSRKTGSP